jgi:hypothetical protein
MIGSIFLPKSCCKKKYGAVYQPNSIDFRLLNSMDHYNLRTQEEINLTNFYLDKWDKILYSTQPVDRFKAEQAVVDAYLHLGLSVPEICFLTSPSPAQVSFLNSVMPGDVEEFIPLKLEIINKLVEKCKSKPCKANTNLHAFFQDFDISNKGEVFDKLCNILYDEAIYECNLLNPNFYKMLPHEIIRTNCWFYDLFIEKVICDTTIHDWHILKALNTECPYLIAYDRICIIIEKPCELHLNCLLLPHADGKAAIKYADGYELYCHHGIVIPEQYGQFHSDNWQAQWILNEQQNPTSRFWHKQEEWGISLRLGIGYKEFRVQLPDNTNTYLQNNPDGYWKKNGHPPWSKMLQHAYDEIILEWVLFYCCEYYNGNKDFEWIEYTPDIESIITMYSLELPEEIYVFYKTIYECDYPMIPGLEICPLMESDKNLVNKFNDRRVVKLFTGCRGEIYYAICPEAKETFSEIYCKFPEQEPMVYAECLTSLILATAQCYQEGAYYLTYDNDSGQKKIAQDLDRVEKIFEKFNPDQIDNWRSIWKNISS